MKKINLYCVKIIAFVVVVLLSTHMHAQVTLFPQVIENTTLSNTNQNYFFDGEIICPGNLSNPFTVTGSSQVEMISGTSVDMKPGFTASALTTGGYFRAAINHTITPVLISPDPSAHIVDGVVHVNKWEKFEMGFTLPQEYTNAVNSFFNHYYNEDGLHHTVDPCDLNPYADDSLIVEVNLTSPSALSYTKWAFYMKEGRWSSSEEDGELEEDPDNPYNEFHWRFRFSPNEENASIPWTYSITVKSYTPDPNVPGSPQDPCYSTYTFSGFSFICDPNLSDNKGFLHLNSNNSDYLQFDNGDGFFGIGENLGLAPHDQWDQWPEYPSSNPGYHKIYKVDQTQAITAMRQLHANGANLASFYLYNRQHGFEYENLGVYDKYSNQLYCSSGHVLGQGSLGGLTGNRQANAWAFDKILDEARNNNIYIFLTVNQYGPSVAYQTGAWGLDCYFKTFVEPFRTSSTSPYDTKLFFITPPDANGDGGSMYFWKRKYKYLLNRWGYSTNIGCIETYREISQTLGYYPFTPGGGSLCSDNQISYPEDPNLKSTISTWQHEILDYCKNGLGDNHLYTISYGGFEGHLQESPHVGLTDFIDYYQPFNDPLLDLLDVHSYDEHEWMNSARFDFVNSTCSLQCSPPIPGFRKLSSSSCLWNNKPIHFGECSTWGAFNVGSTEYKTNERYNNYEISFHNELWATALSGSYSTGMTWFNAVVHRWKYRYEYGKRLGESFTLDLTPTDYTDNIRTLFHHYKRLSEFVAQIDFNGVFVPTKYYDGSNPDIESYYLVDQLAISYGWVHNRQAYWNNHYYYDNNYENFNAISAPASQAFILKGFSPNATYEISFEPTVLGTLATPCNQTLIADANGELSIDLSTTVPGCTTVTLGADTTNADFAFKISFLHSRLAQVKGKTKPEEKGIINFDFSIFPNPTSGIFQVSIPTVSQDNKFTISIYNLLGDKVYEVKDVNTNTLTINTNQFSKGVYFIKCQNEKYKKIKKLIVQ